MIYLYELIDKTDNSDVFLCVTDDHGSIIVEPSSDKNLFLKHFEDCPVEEIKTTLCLTHRTVFTNIFIPANYRKQDGDK